jgi:hypothetical protein
VRRSQYPLKRNVLLVCRDYRARRISRILTLEDGAGSSPSPASGNPNINTVTSQSDDSADASQPVSPPKLRTEEVTKNYVIHEISQDELATRPPWKDTMAAMFGDHVKWEDVKAYVSRGRPLCELCKPYHILTLMEDYTSPTRTAVFHNRPPSAISRSSYQRTLRDTGRLSRTHHDFEP